MASRSTAELLEAHRLPSLEMPDPLPVSAMSQDTMHHLRRLDTTEKRKSIIDPSSIRLSFAGSITDFSRAPTMPLEQGFQKLYKLYERQVAGRSFAAQTDRVQKHTDSRATAA